MTSRNICLALAALACCSASTAAKKSNAPVSPLINALDQCRQIKDSATRLTCYDTAAGALIGAALTGSVTVVDRQQLRQARRSLFGFTMPHLPFFSGDTSVADEPSELTSTIKSAHSIGYGLFRISITDDNAVWETTESESMMAEPRSGQKIVIHRGTLGNYFLRVNNDRPVRARRVG
jgi:hypothetical protein